jgi:hypothetical protein
METRAHLNMTLHTLDVLVYMSVHLLQYTYILVRLSSVTTIKNDHHCYLYSGVYIQLHVVQLGPKEIPTSWPMPCTLGVLNHDDWITTSVWMPLVIVVIFLLIGHLF